GPMLLEGRAMRARKRGRSMTGTSRHRLQDLLPLAPGAGDERLFLVDARPLLGELLGSSGGEVDSLALLFHRAVAQAAREGARRMREHTQVSRVALSGGVFQNVLLRDILIPLLATDGFEVLLNEQVPPGDGGLAVGQAWFEPG
ncbi:MAG TPA: carbamoyltransferase HypF, partial [bacterium]|nr:carbamoyltransferase HypF [bacterium]